MDFKLVVGYLPPLGGSKKQMMVKKKVAEQTCKWMQITADTVPFRCLPLVAGDLNTGLGLDPDRMPWSSDDYEPVGRHHLAVPNILGQSWKKWILTRKYIAATTFCPGAGHTFYGPNGGKSTIDHWILPEECRCNNLNITLL